MEKVIKQDTSMPFKKIDACKACLDVTKLKYGGDDIVFTWYLFENHDPFLRKVKRNKFCKGRDFLGKNYEYERKVWYIRTTNDCFVQQINLASAFLKIFNRETSTWTLTLQLETIKRFFGKFQENIQITTKELKVSMDQKDLVENFGTTSFLSVYLEFIFFKCKLYHEGVEKRIWNER